MNGSFFLLLGVGERQAAGAINTHELNVLPQVSAGQVNPATGTAVFGDNRDNVRNGLTRAHGIFMWISWIFLASTGIFFANWMRPALPNGEWFQVHRALMIASLIVGAIGFLFIFVAQINRPTPGLIDLGGDSERNVRMLIYLMLLSVHCCLILLFYSVQELHILPLG